METNENRKPRPLRQSTIQKTNHFSCRNSHHVFGQNKEAQIPDFTTPSFLRIGLDGIVHVFGAICQLRPSTVRPVERLTQA